VTGTTPEISTGLELPLEPGGEVELLLTSSSVLLRGVERDVVTMRSLSGGAVEDGFTIERLPGKVRIRARDNMTGFRIGPLRVGPGGPADLEIEVPRLAAIALRTVSGDVEATGVAGASSWATTSGDLRLRVDGGPVAAESMSGDVDVVAGEPIELKARSVSGDLTLHGPRFDALAASTTSGDVRIDAALGDTGNHVISSVSGDVELATPSDVRVETQSITGDVRAGETVRSEGKRGRRVLVVGAGTVGVSIRTTSGDIGLRGGPAIDVPVPAAPEPPVAPDLPVAPAPPVAPDLPVAPAPPIVIVAEAEAAPNLVRPTSDQAVDADPDAPGGAEAVVGGGGLDRREAARLEILRALERGDLDIESASHRLEILEDAGPRFFRGWC
jgi:hypothetical protein